MQKRLNFRPVKAKEINCRPELKGDEVRIILYKDARVDQEILDETVGPMNWQRSHSRDNANCTVSIWDDEKKQWISKEDTGSNEGNSFEAAKSLSSDSFKRACFNFGIGRELYTAPIATIPANLIDLRKDKLSVDKIDVVVDPETGSKYIRLITIKVTRDGESDWVWSWCAEHELPRVHTPKWLAGTTDAKVKASKSTAPKTTTTQVTPIKKATLTDDTVILIGQFAGKKFGEAKKEAKFHEYIKWLKNSKITFSSEEEQEQCELLRAI